MRKMLAAFLLLCIYSQLNSQSVFYGLTIGNGRSTISKFDASNNSLTAAYTFGSYGVHPANSEFVEGADGKLYSSTAYGGRYNKGVIFSYDPVTLVNTKLFDLTSMCTGVFTKAAGNLLYGMTTDHIFSFNTSSGAYTVLYTFSIPEKFPVDGLTSGTDGKFYGVTESSIFSFDPATNVYNTLYSFTYDDHGVINAGICFGTDGRIYGVTIGGPLYQGTIFSFDRSTAAFNVVHEFEYYTGEFPGQPLTLGTDGKFYGTTSGGGANAGVIFSYTPSTDTYTKLHDFEQNYSPGRWSRGITRGTDGKFYGVSNGGINAYGVIYSLDPVSGTYTKLHDFDNYNDDEFTSGKLFQASNGKFYGLTYDIDDNKGGKIFSYDAASDNFSLLQYLDENADGNQAYHSLLKSGDLLYGMTSAGGTSANGVIFSFNPLTDTYNKLHDFNGTNGKAPHGNLIPTTNGLFYGLTKTGGATDNGVLFSFDPATNSYVKLYDFTSANGRYPFGNLTQADNGKLYGMTSEGGANSLGVIFSFDLTTNTYTKLFDFTTASGNRPRGSLVKANNGKLYGLATLGGVETYGTIFSFDPTTNTFSRLYDFEYANGIHPHGDLMLATDGLFYGMTSAGGSIESGVLFSFDPASNIVTNLHDFLVNENPYGSLIEDNGKLYGMTSTGGINALGTVFSYALNNHTFSKLQDFDGANGSMPQFGFLTKYGTGSAPPPPTKFVKVNVYGGTNPYNNTEWNNWNSNASLSSGNLKYSDGTNSSINAVLSQQNSVSDNGTPYNSTMAPPEVIRYTSYSAFTRTLTISGLDNSKTYDLEIYASRKGVSNNTSRFAIGTTTIDILTDNNLANKAAFTSLTPNSGQIIVNISKLNSYNYVNGFILTEKGIGVTNPAPTVNAGADQTLTLPANSTQLNASASDPNGTIVAYHWQKIAGPSQYTFDAVSVSNPTISNLVEGTYIFRVRATDNDGSSAFDDVSVTVSASAPTKFVKVNIYGGSNPYNHPEWNNWNTSTLSSGLLKFSDGTNSSISASLSQQTGISDNSATYSGPIAPAEVIRYASYSSSNRTLTISGLDNSKTYNLEIYASRKGVSNNTSRFTIGASSIDIVTDNNLTNKASFISINPTGGQITVNITRLNTYNYINGFILTENGSSPASMEAPVTSILKDDQKVSLIGVYPNPVRNDLVLQLNNNYTGQMRVQVVNLNGVVQKEFRIMKNNKGSIQTNLRVSDLNQGQYFIRIQMGNLIESKKILKL